MVVIGMFYFSKQVFYCCDIVDVGKFYEMYLINGDSVFVGVFFIFEVEGVYYDVECNVVVCMINFSIGEYYSCFWKEC